MSQAVWELLDYSGSTEDILNGRKTFIYTELDREKSTTVFTKDFDDSSMLTLGDRYKFIQEYDKVKESSSDDSIEIDEEYEVLSPYQKLKFFTIDNNKEQHVVESDDICFMEKEKFDMESAEFDDVGWESCG